MFYLVVPGQGIAQATDDGPAISPVLRPRQWTPTTCRRASASSA